MSVAQCEITLQRKYFLLVCLMLKRRITDITYKGDPRRWDRRIIFAHNVCPSVNATRCNSTRVRHGHARFGTSARRPITGWGSLHADWFTMAEGVAESDTNIMPMAGRARGQLSVPDKDYGGVYTYLIYTSSLRLYTQLTRHVLRKRVGPRRAMRTCVGQHPRACTHVYVPRWTKWDPNVLVFFTGGRTDLFVLFVIRDERVANVRDELA